MMQITITARHFDLTDALKSYTKDGLMNLKKYSGNIIFAEVVLWRQKSDHFAEVNMRINKFSFFSKSKEDDLYKAIDSAITKVERQIKKKFGKQNKRHTHKKKGLKNIPQAIDVLDEKGVHKKKVSLAKLYPVDAVEQFNSLDDDFFLFINKEDSKLNLLQKDDNEGYNLSEIEEKN